MDIATSKAVTGLLGPASNCFCVPSGRVTVIDSGMSDIAGALRAAAPKGACGSTPIVGGGEVAFGMPWCQCW
jgi:hypothetical protein